MSCKKGVTAKFESINTDENGKQLNASSPERRNWVVRLTAAVANILQLSSCMRPAKSMARTDQPREFAERERFADEYARGYLAGWHECYAACLEEVERSVSKDGDVWIAAQVLTQPENEWNAN